MTLADEQPHKNEVWDFKESKKNTDFYKNQLGEDVRNIDMMCCFGESITIDAMFDKSTFLTTTKGGKVMMDTPEFVEFYTPQR